MDGGREALLSAIRPCGMAISSSRTLNMNESPHKVGYLLKGKYEDLDSKFYAWIDNIRG